MLENLKFEKITDGTPFAYSIANSIVQDSKGFIWFATDVGLARYDGQNLRLFDPYYEDSQNPRDYSIKFMTQRENGNLIFLSTYLSSLIEFDIIMERFTVHSPFDNFRFVSNLVEVNHNKLLIGTQGNGIYILDLRHKQLREFETDITTKDKSPKCQFIKCLYPDKHSQKTYIGTYYEGLFVFDNELETFEHLNYDVENNKHVIVNTIFRDSQSNLWIGQTNGLFLLDSHNNLVSKFSHDNDLPDTISGNWVTSICEDGQGLIWVGTKFGGLNCYSPEEKRFYRIKLNKHNSIGKFTNDINILFKDKTNVIWIGNRFGGYGKFSKDEKQFYCLDSETLPRTSEIDVHTLFIDSKNSFWFGTWANGLYKYYLSHDNRYELFKFEDMDRTTILSIVSDEENGLWIGCNKYGLIHIDIDDNQISVIEQDLFLKIVNQPFFYSDCKLKERKNSNRQWLVVGHKHLLIFDTQTQKIIENETISNAFRNILVMCVYEDSNDDIWIGTQGSGVFKYVRSTDQLSNFNFDPNNNESLSDTIVHVIIEDQEKNLWFGTVSGGICKLDSITNRFTRVTIPGKMANAMLLDQENNFWISANSLLLKYDIKNNNITSYPGLNDFNSFSSFKSSDGTMYFGGKNGVTYFKPEEITTNPHVPQIALTDFKILHESVTPSPDNPFLKKSITYADEITLTHKENVITFEFASLIYNDPKQNQHAYKMEGFDEDWVYCGTRRSATYTNLDPGEYTFRVKGSNNDGLWNEEGTSIKLKISPPWQKTVLFKSLVGLGVLAGLGSFYKKRVKRLNEENLQREEFTKKLIESQENERKRVAAELHDSIGQDLLILKNKLLTSIKKAGDEKYIQQLSELSDLTSSAIDDVRQISYNLRPYELDRLGLTKTIESMIERANEFTDINFKGRIENIDQTFPPETGINLYRIIQESLNNVIKHSEAGEVLIRVRKSETSVEIGVSDDGKGFDLWNYRMNSDRNGFGLKGIEERVRLFNGEFNVESSPGKGTKIRISIPIEAEKSH